MKWDGDRHLIAAITGTFADAMYGSELSFIKKKYAKDGQTFHFNDITMAGEAFGYHHGLVREMADISFTNRTFYPKNCALTNVELHKWVIYPNKFEDYRLEEHEKEQILKAGRTGWENRYGIYLDDGWLYCYRSYSLLLRFKLRPDERGYYYHIDDFQISTENGETITNIEITTEEESRWSIRELYGTGWTKIAKGISWTGSATSVNVGGSFEQVIKLTVTVDETTAIKNVETTSSQKAGKFIKDGKLVIVKDGKQYNAAGQKM